MYKFIYNILRFLAPIALVIIVLIVVVGILLPTTPRDSNYFLMASIDKNELLKNTPSPRIIFVGGSNFSFGLNSQAIKDSLKLNPVNTGLHGALGLKYMMDNTFDHIQEKDVVILAPEYSIYFRDLNSVSDVLTKLVFDVDLTNIKYFNIQQVVSLISRLAKYSILKFDPRNYTRPEVGEAYSINSFNQYGDAYVHWSMQSTTVNPVQFIEGKFNYKTIKYIETYNQKIKNRGAILFVSFPSYQSTSYLNTLDQVLKVEQELKKSNLNILGTSERYKMADSLMFDTPYHLNKIGIDMRTRMLIEDFKKRNVKY